MLLLSSPKGCWEDPSCFMVACSLRRWSPSSVDSPSEMANYIHSEDALHFVSACAVDTLLSSFTSLGAAIDC